MFERKHKDEAFTRKCVRFRYRDAGHTYGNFPEYYKFNPTNLRMQFMNKALFIEMIQKRHEREKAFRFLDVGCNAGDLTNEIFSNIVQIDQNALGYGVDVDRNLIKRAKSRFRKIEFDTLDASSSSFVENIQSKTLSFDLVTCFGTTMWIHLHHGDKGLETFLRRLATLSSSYLLLEPQPIKCYRNAKKRMKRSKIPIPEATKHLQWVKSNEILHSSIDQVLSKCGFTLAENLGRTKWKRRILLYKKK